MEEDIKQNRLKPLTLYPLKLSEALSAFLLVNPSKIKPVKRKNKQKRTKR